MQIARNAWAYSLSVSIYHTYAYFIRYSVLPSPIADCTDFPKALDLALKWAVIC